MNQLYMWYLYDRRPIARWRDQNGPGGCAPKAVRFKTLANARAALRLEK